MDTTIVLILLQDGVLNGAIYALLGLALVLVFVVTRVIFIPQREFVAFGALTLAFMVNGPIPGTVNLLHIIGALAFAVDDTAAMRSGHWTGMAKTFSWSLLLPFALYLLAPLSVS